MQTLREMQQATFESLGVCEAEGGAGPALQPPRAERRTVCEELCQAVKLMKWTKPTRHSGTAPLQLPMPSRELDMVLLCESAANQLSAVLLDQDPDRSHSLGTAGSHQILRRFRGNCRENRAARGWPKELVKILCHLCAPNRCN